MSVGFQWHGKCHFLVQNGDFFDFFKRDQTEQFIKLKSFSWPFRNYSQGFPRFLQKFSRERIKIQICRQFELLRLSVIEKANEKIPPPQIPTNLPTRKLLAKQGGLVHFLLTVKVIFRIRIEIILCTLAVLSSCFRKNIQNQVKQPAGSR